MLHNIEPHKLRNEYCPKEAVEEDYVFFFQGDTIWLNNRIKSALCPVIPTIVELAGISKQDLRYLFAIEGRNYYLLMDTSFVPLGTNGEFVKVRSLRYCLMPYDKEACFAIMTGWHLFNWYQDHVFCGRCGTKTVHATTQRMLQCPKCHNMIFPTIAPAVIIGVVKGEYILMSKYSDREYIGYALLAGFMEIAETPEDTVRREVMEEVSLHVKNIRYYKSQPGGVDGNVLLGFFCDLDGDDTIHIDETELAMAQWYHRDEIPIKNDGYSLTFEMITYFEEHPEKFPS